MQGAAAQRRRRPAIRPQAARRTTYRRAWRTTLAATTELAHELPTRAAELTTDDGPKAITMSSLDRVYTTIPPPVLAEAATTVEVGQIRGALYDNDRAPLSDHVYVRTTIRLRPSMPPHVRPIPSWNTRHPLYASEVRRRLNLLPLESLHPHDALRQTKQAICSAAAATRNRCLRRRPTTPSEYTRRGLQIARALARNDMPRVRSVADSWPAARATLDTTDGTTTIADLPALTKLIGMAIADPTQLTKRNDGDAVTTTHRPTTTRHGPRSAQRRWLRLWVPHMQRQWLARVVLPTDEPDDATSNADMDPNDIRTRLQSYWAGQFQPRHINERLSLAMARTFVHPTDASAWTTPSPAAIRASLRRARDTAPGPDGVPYSDWKNAGPRAHSVLARLLVRMTAERAAPARFSDAIAAFLLPKGAAPHDPPNSGQRARRPENTRPLALKHTDCKTVASTINFLIRNAMKVWTVPQQRGFVATRGPLQLVVRLETLARTLSMEAMDSEWDSAGLGDA